MVRKIISVAYFGCDVCALQLTGVVKRYSSNNGTYCVRILCVFCAYLLTDVVKLYSSKNGAKLCAFCAYFVCNLYALRLHLL
jgi:hypothetical protein